MPIDLEAIIETVGYPGLFLIIFAETGLLIGFFLPGDTLLITTGFLAQRGHFDVWLLIPLLILAAIAGDATGYHIGRSAGPRIFRREDSRFFRRRHLERAHTFYERHGGKTIMLARFLAFVRTFAPTVAGAAEMPYRKFALYNVTGGVAWIMSMVLLGYFVGERVPNVEVFLLLLVAFFLGVSLIPAGWHLVQRRRARLTIKGSRFDDSR
ncbi:MAG: VTT domain-containing protein [Dehalococcoidia bacterium]|nr:VTT domain-containing protein [Dehalococcoidia bacterium]